MWIWIWIWIWHRLVRSCLEVPCVQRDFIFGNPAHGRGLELDDLSNPSHSVTPFPVNAITGLPAEEEKQGCNTFNRNVGNIKITLL